MRAHASRLTSLILLCALFSAAQENRSAGEPRGAVVAGVDSSTSNGRRVVVTIGIDHYKDWPKLRDC
jgi:hypothetical protein